MPFLEPLSDNDIADALSAASSVGDYRIEEAADRRGQPRVVDARLVRTAAAVVHRRLPDRRPHQVRHLRRPTILVRPPTAVDAVADATSTRGRRSTLARQRNRASSATTTRSPTTPSTAWPRGSRRPVRRRGSSTAPRPSTTSTAWTVAAMRERLGLQVDLRRRRLDLGDLNVIASPLQTMRDVFDSMATDTDGDWALISRRLSQLPTGSRVTPKHCARRWRPGERPPPASSRMASSSPARSTTLHRHGRRCGAGRTQRCTPNCNPPSPRPRTPTASLVARAPRRHRSARSARGRVWPRRVPAAVADFLGATVDFDEAYQWGLRSTGRIVAEQDSIANRLYPGVIGSRGATAAGRRAALPDARHRGPAALDAGAVRPRGGVAGRHALRHRPSRCATLECRIAPTHTGGIYYTGPSEDLSRPGRMWWSVPHGRRHVSHLAGNDDGVPRGRAGPPPADRPGGRVLADRLNRWRRLGCWVSGHGEGWALYAERLMAELGWLDDAGNRMGMLDAQRFRAARVVIDIGVHCGLTAPDGGALGRRTGVGVPAVPQRDGRGESALRAGPLPGLARAGSVVCDRTADLAAAARRDARPRV